MSWHSSAAASAPASLRFLSILNSMPRSRALPAAAHRRSRCIKLFARRHTRMTVARTVLDSGVTVVTEQVPHLRSATIGVWSEAGSRVEAPRDNGIAHFIEHMLFKGTARRKALDISREIESVGGTLNACTEREYVFFFAKVLAKDFPLAVDILSDIYLNSVFDGEELERERDVVLQEILMVEDNPEESLDDFFHESYWR